MMPDKPMTGAASDMQSQLAACRNTQEVRVVLNDFCAEFGEIIIATLLCGKQSPGKTTCIVDFTRGNAQTSLCAHALGGRVFGFNSVVFNFPTPPDFGCIQRFPADSPACSCVARS